MGLTKSERHNRMMDRVYAKKTELDKQREYDKEVKLEVAYDIIGNLDDTALQTVWIDKAIDKLQQLKRVRNNIPF